MLRQENLLPFWYSGNEDPYRQRWSDMNHPFGKQYIIKHLTAVVYFLMDTSSTCSATETDELLGSQHKAGSLHS